VTTEQLLEILGVPTGAGVTVGLGVLVVRWLRAGGERRLRRTATQLLGDGERRGLLETVEAHGADIAAIRAQLEPDHGGSLHDVLVRVDERTLRIEQRLDAHIASPHMPTTWPVNRR
jgi:hypothetical protein